MQQALLIPQDVMRTAAQQSSDGQLMAPAPAGTELALSGNGVGNEQHLAQANEFNTSNPNHPLKRTVVINIRSSLSDLCLKKSRATWSPPSAEATKAILQQRKFVDLQGTSEQQVLVTPRPTNCNRVPRFLFSVCHCSQTGRPEVDCPAQDGAPLAAEQLPRGARRAHQRRGRQHLLSDRRGVLHHCAARDEHAHRTVPAGGRHGACVRVRAQVPVCDALLQPPHCTLHTLLC